MSASKKEIRLVAIVGPTGAGKSAIAADIAVHFNGEIVSADSMQVYRYMDIGTAKPDRSIRKQITHHMLDVVNPDDEYNAAMYADEATKAVDDINKRQQYIFLVGGTGLYIRALCRGLLDAPSSDGSLRKRYRDLAAEEGIGFLYDELRKRDSIAARNIHPHDLKRIIRALEVLELSGERISYIQEKHHFAHKRYNCLMIGLIMDRQKLYEKIDNRVDQMMQQGLVEEVDRLLDMGYDSSLKPMQSMCYKYIIEYRNGGRKIEDAIHLIKRDTRHYAKRQLTWFNQEKEIKWMSPTEYDAILKSVEQHLTY